MGKTFQLFLLGLLSLGLVLSGCSQQEKTDKVAPAETSPPKEALKIFVPAEVKDRWHAVKIAILDHTTGAEKTYTIALGETFQVPNSALSLRVDTFLPAFIMNGSQMTSQSNETRNPAAYVVVTDNQQPLFAGWLFSLYPDAHAFHEARYNFNLTGYVPAR